jgi:sensor histidine kinase regulating citrate/malate metabolism
MQDQQGQDAMGVGSMIREVQELAEKFKGEDDDHYVSPYAQLEKAKVLQEARYVVVLV